MKADFEADIDDGDDFQYCKLKRHCRKEWTKEYRTIYRKMTERYFKLSANRSEGWEQESHKTW